MRKYLFSPRINRLTLAKFSSFLLILSDFFSIPLFTDNMREYPSNDNWRFLLYSSHWHFYIRALCRSVIRGFGRRLKSLIEPSRRIAYPFHASRTLHYEHETAKRGSLIRNCLLLIISGCNAVLRLTKCSSCVFMVLASREIDTKLEKWYIWKIKSRAFVISVILFLYLCVF